MSQRRWKTLSQAMLCASACWLLCGCGGVRVVTVPTTEPVQLAEPIRAYVYVATRDGQRVKSSSRAQLYEGEWVLSDPGK
jgi:hypothetical protein